MIVEFTNRDCGRQARETQLTIKKQIYTINSTDMKLANDEACT